MLCLFEMIVFLGFVDTYMVFFYFNLHRGEAVSTIDFIFQLIPAILSKLRNQFTFRHPMIDRNNRKVFDVSCSLLSGIWNAKYVNAVPLYRQEQEFQRMGVSIDRGEMAHWMICISRGLIFIIIGLMKQQN